MGPNEEDFLKDLEIDEEPQDGEIECPKCGGWDTIIDDETQTHCTECGESFAL